MPTDRAKKPAAREEFIKMLKDAAKNASQSRTIYLTGPTKPTISGTATLLGVHRDTLYAWLKEFHVDFMEIADSIPAKDMAQRLTKEDLEAKLEDILGNYESAGKKIFVIMPFDSTFDDVWKGAIERASNAEHFACLRVDEVNLSTSIMEDIKK